MDALADIITPDYTILTPIGKKHLATLGNVATLTAETLKLISKTSREGWSLLPRDVNVEANLREISCPYFF
jgi:Alr-MurF fusion protein